MKTFLFLEFHDFEDVEEIEDDYMECLEDEMVVEDEVFSSYSSFRGPTGEVYYVNTDEENGPSEDDIYLAHLYENQEEHQKLLKKVSKNPPPFISVPLKKVLGNPYVREPLDMCEFYHVQWRVCFEFYKEHFGAVDDYDMETGCHRPMTKFMTCAQRQMGINQDGYGADRVRQNFFGRLYFEDQPDDSEELSDNFEEDEGKSFLKNEADDEMHEDIDPSWTPKQAEEYQIKRWDTWDDARAKGNLTVQRERMNYLASVGNLPSLASIPGNYNDQEQGFNSNNASMVDHLNQIINKRNKS